VRRGFTCSRAASGPSSAWRSSAGCSNRVVAEVKPPEPLEVGVSGRDVADNDPTRAAAEQARWIVAQLAPRNSARLLGAAARRVVVGDVHGRCTRPERLGRLTSPHAVEQPAELRHALDGTPKRP